MLKSGLNKFQNKGVTMTRLKYLLIFLFFVSFVPAYALAVELEVQGEGSALITENTTEVQYSAKKEAINKAVAIATNKILGADATKDPRVQQKFNEIVSQLSTYKVKQNDTAHKEDDRYIVNTVLIIDETKFRKLISDMGIASATNTVRSSAIMTILDEFFTTPSDLQSPAPLREITVYKYDKDSDYKEGETLSMKSKEAKASSKKSEKASSIDARASSAGSEQAKNQESGSLSAKQKDSGSYSGKGSIDASSSQGSLSASQKANTDYSRKGSVDAKYDQKSSLDARHDNKSSIDVRQSKKDSSDSASSKKRSFDYGHFVSASEDEHEFFTNIKEYQPKNGIPDKQNFTLKSLQGAFQTYDIKILDNDRFRSKYFKDMAITIDKLENSEALDKYVKFARDEAKADFFSIGSSIIVDRGKNTNTDAFVCDGMVAVKVYSTVDSEAIASGALTESSSGNTPDQCRASVADKIGVELGNVIANKIQEYWKKRQMYGMEYIVVLTGEVPPMIRIQFINNIKKVQGVSNVKQRTVEAGKYEFVIAYNGSEPLGDAIFTQIASSSIAATFSNYDYAVDSNQIKFYPAGSIGKGE